MAVLPEGYEPVVAFKLCPPGGLFVELGVYLFDILNDAIQILTFLRHGDFFFAGFMVFFIVLNSLATIFQANKDSESRHVLQPFSPLREAQRCLARKVPTEPWAKMLYWERVIEAPGTGLIGPYGASLLSLTPMQAASALYGLLGSAKAMAEGRLDFEADVGIEAYALKAVCPGKAMMVSAWYFGAFAAELAAFALVSATLHPLATLPGYLLGAAANGVAAWSSGSDRFLVLTASSCVLVSTAMAGGQTQSFWQSHIFAGPGPGWIPAAFILIRFVAWAGLCFLDLPHGLLPLGSLNRPMGLPVLQAKFLRPAVACREALVCFTSQMWVTTETKTNSTATSFGVEVGFHVCSWPASGELSTASTIFNSCLLFLAVVLVPLHMCIVLTMLVLSPTYGCGVDNLSLKEEVKAKQVEIDAFAEQNEEMNGEYTELCLLSEWDSHSDSE
ncbi:unnamed protein product [Symbiodinium sp. CCMP2456]|nr:unnamed protein product [Symbiodinium sp. CCMP2456]